MLGVEFLAQLNNKWLLMTDSAKQKYLNYLLR